MPSLEILLATHNCGTYLPQQLDSLLTQNYRDFSILVSDDGSTDTTPSILASFEQRNPGRIRILDPDKAVRGAVANFSRLMNHATADYVMFCDHDDFWLPHKVALSLERMCSAEALRGASMPLLFHTDLVVTDRDLARIHASYWAYARINPARNRLNHLLMKNSTTGCTIMLNRALYEAARPVPPEAIMHDYWCALVAAALGKIEYDTDGTVLYRQHGGNAVGAKKWNFLRVLKLLWGTVVTRESYARLVQRSAQARALLNRYEDRMTQEQRELAACMADLWSRPPILRWLDLLRKKLLLEGALQIAGLFVTVSLRGAKSRAIERKDTALAG